MTNNVLVSFVIPHRGREHMLRETLLSISGQRGDTPLEVVVVTQNEQLEPATTGLATRLPLRFLHASPSLTISALRNMGARESSGTHLAFLDADVALEPTWLQSMLAVLDSGEPVAIASAIQLAGSDDTPLVRIRTALSNAVIDAPVNFLPGRNLLLRRETFAAVGGFPEHLVTCEDYWFTDRVRQHGQLWYSSRSGYVHLGEDRRFRDLFRKEVWRGQSNLQSLRGRRVAVSEWPSFVMPIWISVWSLLGVGAAFCGAPLAATCALLLALLPFSAYVMRLYFLGQRRIALQHIVAFYGLYFPARAWGTLLGAFQRLGYGIHDR